MLYLKACLIKSILICYSHTWTSCGKTIQLGYLGIFSLFRLQGSNWLQVAQIPNTEARSSGVTGTARGIGFSTASLLAQHGTRMVLVDLHEDPLKNACAHINSQAKYPVRDVSDWDEQVKLFSQLTSTRVYLSAGLDYTPAECRPRQPGADEPLSPSRLSSR